uniref:Uncharacterized protein n=1 Tax=Octopus bimaculoides TaxID=37653 RepID=A0A0L8FZC5_OCTBM
MCVEPPIFATSKRVYMYMCRLFYYEVPVMYGGLIQSVNTHTSPSDYRPCSNILNNIVIIIMIMLLLFLNII